MKKKTNKTKKQPNTNGKIPTTAGTLRSTAKNRENPSFPFFFFIYILKTINLTFYNFLHACTKVSALRENKIQTQPQKGNQKMGFF